MKCGHVLSDEPRDSPQDGEDKVPVAQLTTGVSKPPNHGQNGRQRRARSPPHQALAADICLDIDLFH